ncbi:hypothetical protein H6G00_00875 [Leptolyngbya sp. FACHB-541]|uniref:hypothetical protein n=1 Tax=Leptolyngbya sp. FACHB-541 TaxID=2692810 RepID=UPI0016833930|nr:hypothetical protein [Leptolyngbya sp. FACHB-541]MBD1995181.1 hypothetical protein [Leptolyngbya sp. FACHB-541]
MFILYRGWLIFAVPICQGYEAHCFSPDDFQSYTDWATYQTANEAVEAGKDFVDQDFLELAALIEDVEVPDTHLAIDSMGIRVRKLS